MLCVDFTPKHDTTLSVGIIRYKEIARIAAATSGILGLPVEELPKRLVVRGSLLLGAKKKKKKVVADIRCY